MKTLKLIAAGIVLLFSSTAMRAQVSVNVNIGSPPAWGPAGYSATEYYYLPDVQAYYDIRQSQFIYLGGSQWIRSRNLPAQYRSYDLYHGYKVVLNDYHGSRPYTYFKNHKFKYYKGYKGKPQKTIGVRKVVIHKDSYKRGNKGYGHQKNENNARGNGKDKH